MNNAATRKRLYAVETPTRRLSEHKTYALALSAISKWQQHAAAGLCGLTPETLFTVTRWDGRMFVATSDRWDAMPASEVGR